MRRQHGAARRRSVVRCASTEPLMWCRRYDGRLEVLRGDVLAPVVVSLGIYNLGRGCCLCCNLSMGSERHGHSSGVWSATRSQECEPLAAPVASYGGKGREGKPTSLEGDEAAEEDGGEEEGEEKKKKEDRP